MSTKPLRFKPRVAMAVVVANMIGTGVFTSLGFQLVDIQSGFVILMLWVVGGIMALCGALSYAELGSIFPRSGGEYNFLSEIYHPMAGFVSGWVSATIGFAAPTALAAITFGKYLSAVFPLFSPTWLACTLVLVLTGVHATSRQNSAGLQSIFTVLKIVLILVFCTLCWVMVDVPQSVEFLPSSGDGALIGSASFAIALIFVNYAYTGWNAATYLSGELEEPQKNLPRILVVSTLVVMVLYVLLNFTFLYVAPIDALVGRLDVGYVASQQVFGGLGADIMGVLLSLLLISTVSAMVLAGPRVLHVIGQDFPVFRRMGKANAHGVPALAIWVQALLTLAFILSASFESILVFAGFTLGVNTIFTVGGVFVLRWTKPDLHRPFSTWGYPVTPLIYLLLSGWTLVYILLQRLAEGLSGMLIIAAGVVFYWASVFFGRKIIASEQSSDASG
ncbi:MAG: amino acid permease [Pseudomonadales bacterium]|nr:amino acid permease [Pseudomonadales bacterium]